MGKRLNLEGKDMAMFIIRVIWLIAALVVWIIALVMVLNPQGESADYAWWAAGGLCCIPILFPVLRFVFRLTRGGAAAGSTVWDVGITESGRVYASNHAFSYGLITFIIAIALVVVAGLIVLPIYWIYTLIMTLKVLFANIY